MGFYQALQDDIKNAKSEINLETYIWRADEVGKEFLQLLVEAAKRGVSVRVLLDELGSFWLRESYFQPLIEAGGQFSWCHTLSPLRNRYSFNLRNHRKLQIIIKAFAALTDGTVKIHLSMTEDIQSKEVTDIPVGHSSRTTSMGLLSSRNPWKEGCLKMPSSVHSAN